MEINKTTLKALEWEAILVELSRHASCEPGRLRCLRAEVYIDINTVKLEQCSTTELKTLLDKALYPPISGIRDIVEAIDYLKTGQTLNNAELIDIGNNLAVARRLKTFFHKYKEDAPLVHSIALGLFDNKELEDDILEKFDDAGNLIDSASASLKGLRNSLKDQTDNLKNKLNSLINSSEFSKMLQNPVYTMRGDRYVVPVKVEHKAHVPGIVHDMSASGATVYVEPESIVRLNNKLREIELEIEAEIRRILADLTEKCSLHKNELLWSLENLTEIDFIMAKAKYSIAIKGIEPEINAQKYISLKGVRHPILLKVLDNVIPNDVDIGKDYQVMIITGPNTGGKTVILKTIGTCLLMARAGLHIPAIEASIYPFSRVFADIGDEQSITQSLSTFSGHIKNIINILENTDDETLVLLDEVGAGTDPIEGTVLAEAIMEYIKDKGAVALTTTHFSELKALAYTKPGFYNASVEFDIETLSPTYKLLMGLPGRSNAIEIARKLGLDEEIIEKARNEYLNKKDPTGKVLEGLQNTQQELSKNARVIAEEKEKIEEIKKNYDAELEKIKSEKKKIINIYRKKFDAAYFQAKEEISHILSEVKNKGSFSRLGETISKVRKLDYEETEKLKPQRQQLNWDKAVIGDTIFIKSLDNEGILLSLPDKNNNIQVQVGVLKTTINKNEAYAPDVKKPVKEQIPHRQGFTLEKRSLSNTLDVRGERANDALDKVELYLDKANLANLSPVYIIHGHGTGVLKQIIRDYLKKSKFIKSFKSAEQSEGGDGVTVVELV